MNKFLQLLCRCVYATVWKNVIYASIRYKIIWHENRRQNGIWRLLNIQNIQFPLRFGSSCIQIFTYLVLFLLKSCVFFLLCSLQKRHAHENLYLAATRNIHITLQQQQQHTCRVTTDRYFCIFVFLHLFCSKFIFFI